MTAPVTAQRAAWTEVIPAHMKQRAQWVAWGPDPETGRPKCPLIIGARGRRASSTDPTTWRCFAAAVAHHERHASPRTGVGYVFTAADALVFVDVDDCLDARGRLKPWAVPLVEPFLTATYVERSPGRRGLHVFVRGAGPEAGKRIAVGDGAVELYTRGRYSTITADFYGIAPDIGEAPDALRAVLALVDPPRAQRPPRPPPRSSSNRDAELAEMALQRLDPDCDYAQWIAIGMALHSRFPGGEGFAMWDAWSSNGEKYQGTGDLETHWRSFTAGKGVGFGTLIALARGGAR
jgi:hypothetical protein